MTMDSSKSGGSSPLPAGPVVDRQVRGPYRVWVHTHTFAEERGGTRVEDHVAYDFLAAPLVHRWLVAPDLARIFTYRAEALLRHFGVDPRPPLPAVRLARSARPRRGAEGL